MLIVDLSATGNAKTGELTIPESLTAKIRMTEYQNTRIPNDRIPTNHIPTSLSYEVDMNEFIAPQFPKFGKTISQPLFPSPAKNGIISMPLSMAVYCLSGGDIAVSLSVGDSLVIDTRASTRKHLEPGDEMVWNGTLNINTNK